MMASACLFVPKVSAESADGCVVVDLIDSVNLENTYFNRCSYEVEFSLAYYCNGHAVMTIDRHIGANGLAKAPGSISACNPSGGNTLEIRIANPRRA
jgi:hypothetical protein